MYFVSKFPQRDSAETHLSFPFHSLSNCSFLFLLTFACMRQGHTLQDIHSGSAGPFRLHINALKYQQTRAVTGGEGIHSSGTRDEMRVEDGEATE